VAQQEHGRGRSRASEQDRRVRILRPTEKLRAHDRDWLPTHFAPLTILYPQHDYGLVMRRDPEFQVAFRRACIPFIPFGAKVLFSVPDMLLFLNHAAGYMVIAALRQIAMSDGDPSHAAMPYHTGMSEIDSAFRGPTCAHCWPRPNRRDWSNFTR